jgi:hypothetical protein
MLSRKRPFDNGYNCEQTNKFRALEFQHSLSEELRDEDLKKKISSLERQLLASEKEVSKLEQNLAISEKQELALGKQLLAFEKKIFSSDQQESILEERLSSAENQLSTLEGRRDFLIEDINKLIFSKRRYIDILEQAISFVVPISTINDAKTFLIDTLRSNGVPRFLDIHHNTSPKVIGYAIHGGFMCQLCNDGFHHVAANKNCIMRYCNHCIRTTLQDCVDKVGLANAERLLQKSIINAKIFDIKMASKKI